MLYYITHENSKTKILRAEFNHRCQHANNIEIHGNHLLMICDYKCITDYTSIHESKTTTSAFISSRFKLSKSEYVN